MPFGLVEVLTLAEATSASSLSFVVDSNPDVDFMFVVGIVRGNSITPTVSGAANAATIVTSAGTTEVVPWSGQVVRDSASDAFDDGMRVCDWWVAAPDTGDTITVEFHDGFDEITGFGPVTAYEYIAAIAFIVSGMAGDVPQELSNSSLADVANGWGDTLLNSLYASNDASYLNATGSTRDLRQPSDAVSSHLNLGTFTQSRKMVVISYMAMTGTGLPASDPAPADPKFDYLFTSSGGDAGHEWSVDFLSAEFNQRPLAVLDDYTALPRVTLSVPAPGVMSNDTITHYADETIDPGIIYSSGASGHHKGGWWRAFPASDLAVGPTSVTLVTGPTRGTLILNSDGSLTYWSIIGGNDSFVYRAHSPEGHTSDTTVTIHSVLGSVSLSQAFFDTTPS